MQYQVLVAPNSAELEGDTWKAQLNIYSIDTILVDDNGILINPNLPPLFSTEISGTLTDNLSDIITAAIAQVQTEHQRQQNIQRLQQSLQQYMVTPTVVDI